MDNVKDVAQIIYYLALAPPVLAAPVPVQVMALPSVLAEMPIGNARPNLS